MFDAKLKEGVEYFEQMLRVMPDDRTTLEFLAVAYPQMGEVEKAEHVLAELARVLLKEGDIEHASALLERLEACESPEAKIMALRVKAASAPRPELVPESAPPVTAVFASACAAEAALAEKLGEPETAANLRALPDNGSRMLVSALATLEKEKPEACEKALAALADEFGDLPVPLDAFEPDRKAATLIGEELVQIRGVIPFAKLGEVTLIAWLSPHDENLRNLISRVLSDKVRFYLAEPRLVEAALAKLFGDQKN